MIKYQILHEKIVYFPGVIPDIENLIDTIKSTRGVSLGDWETWFAYGSSEDPYGEIKYLRPELLKQETDEATKAASTYVLEALVGAMSSCASKYAEIYEIDNRELEFAERALRFPKTKYGINRYFEGQHMGPHVDWNERNSDITYTIVVYLNDDYEGGELHFVDPSIDIKIKPQAGSIVVFPSTMPYLHQSCKLIKGQKMLITHHWKNDSLSEPELVELNDSHVDLVETFRSQVREKTANAYMLTVARDGESPVRSIYFYDNAIDASTGYEAYQDWGFAKDFLTVTLYEPTGKVHEKTLRRPSGGECTFIRDDYVQATEIFIEVKDKIQEDVYNQIVLEFANLFSKDNQRFDYKRFLTNTEYTGEK
jgi:hypothetical protein